MSTRFLDVGRTGVPRPLCVVAGAVLLAMLLAAPAGAVDITVTGVDTVGNETPITSFRWVLEQDETYHVPLDLAGNPIGDDNTLSVGFHRSYMPVVNQGIDAATFAAETLDPTKHYYVSVVPMEPWGFSIGGAAIAPGQTSVEVFVNQHPIPTAQIVVQVCHDNNPINNVCDPTEEPLEGFKVILEDAGGRYGAAAGLQSYDVFGNPLGTRYFGTCSGGVGACEFDSDCTFPEVCTAYDYDNPILGAGIDTGPDGIAYFKNLAPGKYGVIVVPPAAEEVPAAGGKVRAAVKWQQTATIEGKKVIDAWVEAGEPPFFAEFGPPGPHVFVGFIQEFSDLPDTGGHTISGQVVNLHMSRPPDYAMYAGAPLPHTGCWVGLNQGVGGVGGGVYAAPCADEGFFAIPNVPDGPYQLVAWDENLDVIFASKAVVVAGGDLNVGVFPVRQWFGRFEHWVYLDDNGDGIWQEGEPGIPEQAVNLRWRSGDLYQGAATDLEGFVPFDEVFPFFSWLVAEVDFARFKATGATMWVDDGGPTIPDVLGGHTTPQDQLNPPCTDSDPACADIETAEYRVEQGLVLTQGFQLFLGQTSVMAWGKQPYGPDENGGISGVVWYSTTRAEDDERYGGAEPWEVGVPGVQVNLHAVTGEPSADGTCPGGPTRAIAFDETGAVRYCGIKVAEALTDSWDESIPTGCKWGTSEAWVTGNDTFQFDGDGDGVFAEPDCYDGMRNWNQIRPAVFDGGYAFDECWIRNNNPRGCEDVDSNHANHTLSPLPPGRYVVEAVPRQGYETVRSQDRNVDFGDEYDISGLLLPPECVGVSYDVPDFLSLNTDTTWTRQCSLTGIPCTTNTDCEDVDINGFCSRDVLTSQTLLGGDPVEAPLAGTAMPGCERKLVNLSNGANAAAEFFHFTQVPIAAHAIGFILDDSQNEFDPSSPNFGEKYAPPFVPVSIRDWTGREIHRTLSDGFGRYNFLAPSTWTNSLPQPSGMSPNMLTTCMNAKYRADLTADPNHNPQFSQFCYTFQYMPGATVYLDTPVVPVSAFTAAADAYPLDCQFEDGTPRVWSVDNGSNQGPWLSGPGTLTITAVGFDNVPNPGYRGFGVPDPGDKTIVRDYSFGCASSDPTVTIGGVPATVISCTADTVDGKDLLTVSTAVGGQLEITRTDNGLSTVNGVTVHVGGAAPTVVSVPSWDGANQWGAIQAAIEGAADGDLITVAPGAYTEMVQMRKAVRLQGWGEGSQIDAVEHTPSALQAWRTRVQAWLDGGLYSLVPGQEVGAGPLEPVLLFNEEGAGVLVLSQAGNTAWDDALIDGFTISGADSGGGIVVNGYAEGMQISNNRILNNAGFLSGGIRLGHPTLIFVDGDVQSYPDAGNHGIAIHRNYVSLNGGIGGAGGGVSLCTGSDGYQLTDNYICGNFNMDHGGGVAHYGLSDGGLIEGNTIIFNENFQQSPGAWSGAGVLIAGQPGFPGELSPGSGDVTVNANLIQGNSADAGNGGGMALLRTNGQDAVDGDPWSVTITNNMVTNNLAGLAGGGMSLQDATNVTIRHNTIARNDSTATAGLAVEGNAVSTPQPGAGIASFAHADLAGLVGTTFSVPALLDDNIVWQNRQFVFVSSGFTVDPNGAGVYALCPDLYDIGVDCSLAPADFQNPPAVYDDLGVIGVAGTLTCTNCITTTHGDPTFVADYETQGRAPWVAQPEQQTIATPAAIDEGGNFVRLRFGPLTLWELDEFGDPTGLPYGDYHLQDGSLGINEGTTSDPSTDYDGDARPDATSGLADIGADEYCAAGYGQCPPAAAKRAPTTTRAKAPGRASAGE